jgi:M6 family metalloprotease-like protein
LLAIAAPGNAQPARSETAVRELNQNILELVEQLRSADPARVLSLRAQLIELVRSRRAALVELMENDPGAALRSSFSPELLALLSTLLPEAATVVERHGRWTGTLEALVADDFRQRSAKHVHRLKSADRVRTLHLAGPEPQWASGMQVTVAGVEAGGAVAAQTAEVAPQSTGGPVGAACGNTGAQNAVTILVNLPNYTLDAGVDAEHLKGILWGNAYSSRQSTPNWSVDDFWQQNSDGLASLPYAGGRVVGPYLLSSNFNTDGGGAAFCDYLGLAQAAMSAADGDVNFNNFNRVVVVFPYNGACTWSGLSSLGCWNNSTPGDGSFTSSVSWLRSDQIKTRQTGVQLAAHELGHGLGINHAASRSFAGSPRPALGAVGVLGTVDEYGDNFSTMGSWNFGFYATPHAQKVLGWMPEGNYQVVNSTGQYQVEAYETRNATSQVKALKILRDAATGAYIWLEYRTNTGIYDGNIGPQVWSGALLHYEDGFTGTRSHLLDFTPGTATFTDPALAVGETWTDPYSNLSITVNSISGSKLNVTVAYGVQPCTRASPTVTLSPSTITVNPSSTGVFTVTVKNNDSAACQPAIFALTSAQASGFVATLSPTSLNLAPGASGTVTLSEKAGTTVGSFPVMVQATNSANPASSGTGSATVSVVSTCLRAEPLVTLSPVETWMAPSGSKAFTITIKNNNSSLCSSSTFTLLATHPAGFSGTFAKTSLSIGAGATASTTLTEKAGATTGSFMLTVKATDGAATTNFGVGAAAITVAPCTLANPTVAITQTSQSVNTSGAAVYNFSIKNNNSLSCANATYALTATAAPAGLTAALSPTSLSLASGATGAGTLTATAGTTTGNFTITLTAKNSSATTSLGAATTTLTVVPTTVTLATDNTSYVRGNIVRTTLTFAGATPVSGATVKFTMKKANGTAATFSGTTNAAGQLVWSYTLAASDPTGNYEVTAAATFKNVTTNSAAPAKFTVLQ